MTPQTHYVLHVLRAQGLTWESRFPRKQPKLYATVTFDGTRKDTPVIENNLSPEWNSSLTFSSAEIASTFNIQVRHRSILRSDPCIGYVEVQLGELLEACQGGEAVLHLLLSGKKSSGAAGTISLELKYVNLVSSVETDVEVLRRAVQGSGIANTGNSSILVYVDEGSRLAKGSDIYKSIGSILSKLDPIKNVIDDVSRVHPYLELAWKSVSILYEGISNQYETDKKVVDLARALEETFDFVNDTHTLRSKTRVLEQQIIKVLETTSECCKFLQKYIPHGFVGRMLSLGASEEIDALMQSVREQKEDLNSALALHNAHTAARTSDKIDALSLRQQLGIHKTTAGTRHPCQTGTRVEIRRHVIDLLGVETTSNIVWLHGVAGCGKSTIATSIEDYFRDTSQLGAFLKFERGKSDPSTVVRELAYKVALFDSFIRSRIIENIEQDNDIASALLSRQFEKLLLEPLCTTAATASANAQEPVVIVLDALDECGTPDTRADLMRLMKNEFPKLPRAFRFLITSRPEPDIVKALSSRPESVHEIELDYTSDASRLDVLSYLNHEMRDVLDANPEIRIPKEWTWDANIALLGEAAGGLFIWASTAVKLVSTSGNPFAKLKSLVSNSRSLSKFGLDKLYATVLEGSGIFEDDENFKAQFSQVLALLLLSKVSLSCEDIDRLLGFPSDEPSYLILSRLRCLLSYTPGEPVRLFHASFSDYLQSPERSGDPWFIDINDQKSHLAARCFAVMEESLRFNICDLETSLIRNGDVPNLADRLKANIPLHLEYACTYWAQHLVEVVFSSKLFDALSDFVYHRLLFWFEVMSLLKMFRRVTIRTLSDAASWAIHSPIVFSFLKDASSLATVFADPISQSTPHIYVSMLPLTKEDSEVSAHYSKCMNSMVHVERRGIKPKPMWLNVLEGHTDNVISVCFSPDGKRIISGSDDKTIRIWDADSGDLVCNPLEGHTSYIHSVAISRDGQHVVSGSWDNTVRIWDLGSAGVSYRVFEGHTNVVRSVAYAPNGKYVVSGSWDGTVRLWDVESGKAAFEPLRGHMNDVQTVAFSPSGKYIASGSEDMTIIIWETGSGRAAREPFKGHTGSVDCVAFSPDDTYIASGSSDKTIRIWSVATGQVVSEPFIGHAGAVNSVAFSPDGRRVVSGSFDNTIRIWDVEKGEVVGGPFTGHTHEVTSVAFSPDGSHIVSGSWDWTIRVWDASSANTTTESLNEHTSSNQSIAFSPDDSTIASGCRDGIVRVWDSAGTPNVSRCFGGSTAPVWCVTFSPDGLYIISGSHDGTIRVWKSSSGAAVSRPYTGHSEGIRSISVSSDGAYIASGSYDETIRIWDLKTGAVVAGPFVGHTARVASVAFSPDGSRVVSGSWDNTLILWDTKSGDVILGPLTGHTQPVYCVAFSPDGSCFASGSGDRMILVWNASTGDLVLEPSREHASGVTSIAFSRDGSRIASGSYDRTVRVWDVMSGNILYNFKGHMDIVYSVAFSHDGKHIASGSLDKTIRVWNVEDSFDTCDEDVSNWTMLSNGWISSEQGDLLLWVPPDLRPTLLHAHGTTMFGCAFWTRVDFQNTCIGSRWRECFNRI